MTALTPELKMSLSTFVDARQKMTPRLSMRFLGVMTAFSAEAEQTKPECIEGHFNWTDLRGYAEQRFHRLRHEHTTYFRDRVVTMPIEGSCKIIPTKTHG